MPGIASPLTWRQALVILGAVLGATVLVFGVLVGAGLLLRGDRGVLLPLLAAAVPVHAAVVLTAVHGCLRRFGTGWRALGFARPSRRLLHLLWQIPVGLVAVVLVQLAVGALIGGAPRGAGSIDALAADAGPLAAAGILVGVALLTPVWEEAVFRGVVLGGLRRRLPAAPAAVLSALIFAACHGVPVLLPYLFATGLVLAVLRAFHRNLWACVVFHATMNTLASAAVLTAIAG